MGFRLLSKRSTPPAMAKSLPRLPGFQADASVLNRLAATAHVGLAYGDPITVNGRTVIPVGTVGYGFGFGFGSGKGPGHKREGGGGGGGGGVNVQPIAYIEFTKNGTRVRPVLDWTRLIILATATLMPMLVRGRRRWRKRDKKRDAYPQVHT